MPRKHTHKHKQDILASLRGMLAVVVMILVFLGFLMLVVVVERLVLG